MTRFVSAGRVWIVAVWAAAIVPGLNAAERTPATSPDEVELYAVRMLALGCPVSLETNMAALKRHGRTEELLSLLGKYERMRLARSVPVAVRQKLRKGEWHLVRADDKPAFRPVRYDVHRARAPDVVSVRNTFRSQPLSFRLQVVPTLAAPGESGNVPLFRSEPPAELKLPSANAPMPGAWAARIEFARPAADQHGAFLVGPETELTVAKGTKGVDLLRHRALAVRLRVDGPTPAAKALCPVLNVQLESVAKMYREHYVNLDFSGEKTIVISEPTTDRMLAEFRPHRSNYSFKHAGYHFKYGAIMGLNFRWMRLPKDRQVRCAVSLVEALKESDEALARPALTVCGRRIEIPGQLRTGDYAEFWAGGPIRIFDRNWNLLRSVPAPGSVPLLAAGENRVELSAAAPATSKLTFITLGTALQP